MSGGNKEVDSMPENIIADIDVKGKELGKIKRRYCMKNEENQTYYNRMSETGM